MPTSTPLSHRRRARGGNAKQSRLGLRAFFLCICLLWMYVTCVFFRTLPDSTVSSNMNRNNNSNRNSGAFPTAMAPWKQLGTATTRNHTQSFHTHKLRHPSKADPSAVSPPPYTIVHSLTTRFMLGQTGKPLLARARYLLFETFCQPTVRYQTALMKPGHEFFWFVVADPGLDAAILEDLSSLLSVSHFPNRNAYLVLSTNPAWASDGVGVPGVTSYGAGFQEIARAVRDGTVQLLQGDAEQLIRTLQEDLELDHSPPAKHANADPPNPLLLIETMLDADDGLNNHAMEWIQDLAVSHTQHQELQDLTDLQQQQVPAQHHSPNHRNRMAATAAAAPTLNSTWWLLCATDHMEWHNRDIYRLTDQQYRRTGLSKGIVGLRHAPLYCASAGFTRVGLTTERSTKNGPPLQFPQIAYTNHALATEDFDRCTLGNKEGAPPKVISNATNLWSRCFRRDFEGLPLVLKGRTITSDSMDHMGARNDDYRDLPWEGKDDHPLLDLNESDKMWGILQQDFSIDPSQAQSTSVYLREHLATILAENKAGRCAPGFPCREVADVAFKKMNRIVKVLHKVNQHQQQQQQQAKTEDGR